MVPLFIGDFMASVLELLYQRGEDTTITLPSRISAQVREMTGVEQKLLSNRTQMMNGSAINQVLAACTVSIGDVDLSLVPKEEAVKVVTGLLAPDRQALLFNIRKTSLGNNFRFKSKCPECGDHNDWEVNLTEHEFPVKHFNFQKLEGGADNRAFCIFNSTIIPGLQFKANYITGHDEMRAAKNRATLHSLSDLELRDVRASDDGEKWVPVVISKLNDKVLADLRDQIRDFEGAQDDEVTIACPSCGAEVAFNLLALPDFMLPSMR